MVCLKAAVAMTSGVYSSRSFVDCSLFQMGCFVVARFLLTSTLHGSFAIEELLVLIAAPVCHRTTLVTSPVVYTHTSLLTTDICIHQILI